MKQNYMFSPTIWELGYLITGRSAVPLLIWPIDSGDKYTVELQWLEHRWVVYHGYFELVLESLGKNPITADIIIFGII